MIRTMLGGFVGVLSLAMLAGCSASAGEPTGASHQAATAAADTHEASRYLALGDSIAFGEDGYIPYTAPTPRTTPSFFVGYPEIVRFDPALEGVVNYACPGETSGSFLSATAPDNGCREYKSLFPLHDGYAGETQAQAALAFLATHPQTRLVTLNMGANDLLLVEYGCATAANPTLCIEGALPGALQQIGVNVGTILGGIRKVGYTGQIVVLTQYSTNYADPLQSAALPPLNQVLAGAASAFGATVADGYGAFQKASASAGGDACKAGLLIPNPNGGAAAGCDKHPSRYGQTLLALTVLENLKN